MCLTTLIAFLVSAGLVPLISRFALAVGWVDHPGGLKLHASPTPYGGGIAITLGTFLALSLTGTISPSVAVMIVGSLVILLGGVWDDVRPLGIPAKFSLQLAGALAVIACGLHLDIKVLPLWLNLFLTLVWLIGMTNAVNLIDIMDGLAAGVCGIAAFTIGTIGYMFGNIELALLSWSLMGAVFGFLIFNLPPARIFMGDAGAQFLGFMLAALAVKGSYTTFNNIALIAPVLILGLPIFDTVLVSAHRIRRGRSPFRGSADHLPLRLCRMGFSKSAAVMLCTGLTAILCLAAASATLVSIEYAMTIYGIVFLGSILFAFWISGVEVD